MSKYFILDKSFNTKKDMMRGVREVYNAMPVWKWYTEGYVFDFIHELFKMHPHYAVKKGSYKITGFRAVPCDVNPKNKKLVFRTKRKVEEFSYYKCVNRPTQSSEALRLMRDAIQGQIREFRESAFKDRDYVYCELTNLKIRPHEAHVDHIVEFKDIAESFLRSKKIYYCAIKSRKRFTISPKSLHQEWNEYHQKHAKLRIVLDKVNLQRSRLRRENSEIYD